MDEAHGYVIVGMPRSGTNLLCEVLTETGRAGHPDEWYGPSRLHGRLVEWGLAHPDSTPAIARATSWAAYRQRLFTRTNTQGCFAMKLFPHHAEPLVRSGQAASLLDLVPEPCRENLKVILVRRADVVMQAVSVAVAHNTGVYLKGSDPVPTTIRFWEDGPDRGRPVDEREAAYDPEWIDDITMKIRQGNRRWSSWIAEQGLPSLDISYEELVDRRSATLTRVHTFLDLETPTRFPPPHIEKQAGRLNEEIAARYRAWRGLRAT